MKKDSTTVTTTSMKLTTTKFFGQCWIQDYICGGTDCAKRLQNLKTRVRNLFSARFRSSESFVQKSVEGLKIARLETREKISFLQDLYSFPKFSIVQCCAIYLRFIFSHLQRYLHLLIGWVVLGLFPSQLFVTNCTSLTRTAPLL